jgi:hypothetical protein
MSALGSAVRGNTLAKMARRSSWKSDVEDHQLAGKVILRPLYPLIGTAGSIMSSSAGDIVDNFDQWGGDVELLGEGGRAACIHGSDYTTLIVSNLRYGELFPLWSK